MNAPERHNKIVELAVRKGRILIAEIADLFHVSEMTARRDLNQLEREGLLRRFHGGAAVVIGRSYEPSFQSRASRSRTAKGRHRPQGR